MKALPSWIGERRIAPILWSVVAAGMLAVIMHSGRGLGFYQDEFDVLLYRRSGGLDDVLRAHLVHISVAPMIIYKGLITVVGIETFWPYRLVVALMHIGCATFVFLIARDRVGSYLGLAAGFGVLVLGYTAQNILWPYQIGFVGSVLGGLIALWALDRDARWSQPVAAVALVFAVLSSTLGLPFVLGLGVEIAWRRNWRLLWVPGAAVGVYGLWYLGYGESDGQVHNMYLLRSTLAWALDCAQASLGAVFGRAPSWGTVLLPLYLLFVGWGIATRRFNPRAANLVVIAVSFWLIAGLGRSTGPTKLPPESGRYLLIGAVVFVLLAVELVRDVKIERPLLVAPVVVLVLALSAAGGIDVLSKEGGYRRGSQEMVDTELAALELPDVAIDPRYELPRMGGVFAGPYLRYAQSISNTDPARASLLSRNAGDEVLRDVAVKVLPLDGFDVRACRARGRGDIRLAAGGSVAIKPSQSAAAVSVRRFGTARYPLADVAPPGSVVHVAPDRKPAARPYVLSIRAPHSVDVCSVVRR